MRAIPNLPAGRLWVMSGPGRQPLKWSVLPGEADTVPQNASLPSDSGRPARQLLSSACAHKRISAGNFERGQFANIRLSDGCGEHVVRQTAKAVTISTNLEVVWESLFLAVPRP